MDGAVPSIGHGSQADISNFRDLVDAEQELVVARELKKVRDVPEANLPTPESRLRVASNFLHDAKSRAAARDAALMVLSRNMLGVVDPETWATTLLHELNGEALIGLASAYASHGRAEREDRAEHLVKAIFTEESPERRRAIAIGLRDIVAPAEDRWIARRALNVQRLVEDETDPDVREALLITFAVAPSFPPQRKASYLVGLYDSARSEAERARIANAIISIQPRDANGKSNEKRLRPLRQRATLELDLGLRRHLSDLMESGQPQPTGIRVRNASDRAN